jgi:cyclohexyl-isocyanide hydratase
MKVSILVFPGVEELDFVGFLEVLAVANRAKRRSWFETELVGTVRGPIRCGGGMRVVPDKTVTQMRGQDMIFVPGGGASRGTGVDAVSHDERVLRLLRSAERRGKLVWSVCTGALILGSAGLLRGRRATTHHSFLDRLGEYGAKVEKKRVVSDGKITTGGGIASSIDVGLELVRRTLGERTKRAVQLSMEYGHVKLD